MSRSGDATSTAPDATADGLRRSKNRRRAIGISALTTAMLAGLAATPLFMANAAAPAAETVLSEAGWTASSNTNSAAADAPANAIDNNVNTRFSSDAVQASGQWFQVNLGSPQSVNQITMDSGNWPGDYAVGYNVQVSTNGTTFSTVATGTGTSAVVTSTFTASTVQYIRVQLTAASSGAWWSIDQFNAYTGGGTSPTTAPAGGCGTTDLALNKTATASSLENAGDPAGAAVDGNTGTRWSSAFSDPQWLEVDLGSSQAICGVSINWEAAYASAFQIQVSNDNSTWTPIYSTTTGPGGVQNLSVSGTGRYIRMYGTARATGYGYSIWEFDVYGGSNPTAPPTSPTTPPVTTSPTAPPTGPAPPTGGSLGSNVIVFTPTEALSTIQSQLNSLGTQQNPNQFGTQRYELLFEPGTYGTAANPLDFQLGYYEAVEGLGQNPSQVVINGTIDSYNQCPGGDQTNCNATDNFWRSVSNLTINVAGLTGCFSGDEVWAASQASPMRRTIINGKTTLMDFCDGSPDYASGGFIADSELNGAVTNGSQQQYYVRNTNINSWSNAVWNQVFSGDPGAPAQSFAGNSGDSGGPSSYTTLGTTPTSEEEPYLYTDSSGNYNVFVPSLKTNSSGPSYASGNTPGSSLPLSTFYVVNSASTISQINSALAYGDNLLFTPGVYSYNQTINVTKADTKILGLGWATLVPSAGQTTMNVADVNGVNISGLIFDAGPTTSPTLLTVGTQGSTVSHASDPVTVDDVFFRVGGATAGSVTDAFIDNSNNSILDDIWSWRADHGAGAGTWTGDTADTGLTVNGNNVLATGLAVEHYQKYETVWNGQGGEVIFFQNENPYEVPSQSVWNVSSSQLGYPAFYIPNGVTTFTGYGMGSYSYFDQGVAIENAMAFQAPNVSGINFHDLLTVFLNGSGGIQSVINGTGAAVSPSNGGPSDVVSAQ
ncbi:MAG TPA: discoidin domain-containing protein [Actinocrinis sp.]|nr:discoidin domain-containing protein [Actinocrinis sp.]